MIMCTTRARDIHIENYLQSSWRMLILLSLVTRLIPAERISLGPLRHRTVSLAKDPMITHVNRASDPSAIIVGPPVPRKNIK